MSRFNLDGHELWSLPSLGPSCSWKYPAARRGSGLLKISSRTSEFLVLQALTRRWHCQLVLLEAGEVFAQPEAKVSSFSSTPACRAPPRSQTWVNYLLMFSWTFTLLSLLPMRPLRVKAQMRKHTPSQHFVALKIARITSLHSVSSRFPLPLILHLSEVCTCSRQLMSCDLPVCF